MTESRDGCWVEEQNFPRVHQIVLGLRAGSLAAELEQDPTLVSIVDAQGRTALDWATSRAELEDMKVLLSHGSDPNNMDITGRTTLLHAVDSHSTECLRLILEAGACPDPKIPRGLFRSSPLTAAAHGGLVSMVELLLNFGADANACNPEGYTALHTFASAERPVQTTYGAKMLLKFGANPLKHSRSGKTPLSMAIVHHNHALVRLLSREYGKHPGYPFKSEYTDLHSLSISRILH